MPVHPNRPTTLLDVQDLRVSFRLPAGLTETVKGLTFQLNVGEIVALVGESGSGKSVTARALVGLAGDNARVQAQRLELTSRQGEPLDLRAAATRWPQIRGGEIGFVLQDALTSLDPLRTVGSEVAEALQLHRRLSRAESARRVAELLAAAGIPDAQQRMQQYPHQLSGGLRQRALIASALAGGPQILIADEPTTALDATVQLRILALFRELADNGHAILLITHDLAVVSRVADRVLVMQHGHCVEQGEAARVLAQPQHPYTRQLLAAIPGMHTRGRWLSERSADAPSPTLVVDNAGPAAAVPDAPDAPVAPGVHAAHTATAATVTAPQPRLKQIVRDRYAAAPWHSAAGLSPGDRPGDYAPGETVLEALNLSLGFRQPDGSLQQVLRGVSLQLRRGETLGLVGESGSGKTTLGKILLALQPVEQGEVLLNGQPWNRLPERLRRPLRPRIQTITQDPLGSFNPHYRIAQLLEQPLKLKRDLSREQRSARLLTLMQQVGLPAALLDRRPSALSGGQRQRVAIAQALAAEPDILICDEPVSALDVTTQAQILDLLCRLQQQLGLSILLISHDPGVVQHMSHRIAVMKAGEIVETATPEQLLTAAQHPYTRQLLATTDWGKGAEQEPLRVNGQLSAAR
ncbi:dipeptide ABC transporter ATP-binding protein [Erwinia sp. E602]|uniref:dipeptide ABC transporter ATP-binding protein n=1 Tax=Erwinia sp. E602 TaxID=2675378 RepID=UPI001BEF7E96|nr:ABC transporter ATP-binding protein [Erwinia sp. E602]QUG76122.1 dipeptide ABC transporter ATP-binding protein [Erwinia sp. E602]